MIWLWILAAAIVAVLAVMIAEICRELRTFTVTRYTVRSAKLPKVEKRLKIVFLSDLHNRVYGTDNADLYRAVKEEHPDLILIGGDMLVGKEKIPFDPALDLVKKLPSVCPVVCANGNHEQRMKEEPENYQYSYREYREAAEKSGIRFLENESIRMSIKGVRLAVSGLELPLETYKKFRKENISGGDVAGRLGRRASGKDSSEYEILLAHNPTYVKAYLAWGADMILSGHLHGGIVRLPGIGGVITPQAFLFPRYSGEMRKEGEQTVIVSRGLGTHTINLRLFNLPEVVSIELCAERPE